MTEGIRLQKALADAGVASRRASEDLIIAGRVRVNGVLIGELGTRVQPGDKITVDGKPIGTQESRVYIALHKPPGYVSTAKDDRGRPTVLDLVRVPERVYPIGRLDFDSSGLLLLSNDGELVHRLLHPRHEVDKVYEVRVDRQPTDEQILQLEAGVLLDGEMTAPAKVEYVSGTRRLGLRFTIHEGRKRQVRRMCAAVGLDVSRLARIRFGPIRLGDMRPGDWRYLRHDEVTSLRRAADDTKLLSR